MPTAIQLQFGFKIWAAWMRSMWIKLAFNVHQVNANSNAHSNWIKCEKAFKLVLPELTQQYRDKAAMVRWQFFLYSKSYCTATSSVTFWLAVYASCPCISLHINLSRYYRHQLYGSDTSLGCCSHSEYYNSPFMGHFHIEQPLFVDKSHFYEHKKLYHLPH